MNCTPGTWQAKLENDYVPAQVWADGRVLAEVYGEDRATRAANSLCMAASKDLLEACKVALYAIKATDLPSHIEAQEYLEAAIAKAERGAQ